MDPSSSSLSTSSSSQRKMNLPDEPICKKPKYDVFMNYSFKDIGKSFISHAQGALRRNGFIISDHTKLPKGHDERSELLKTIEESKIYVLVFSIKYASSVRCLNELVDIMECKLKFDKKKVLPIFFKVKPSDVRSQQGRFKKAFEAHEAKFDHDIVQKWRQALNDAGHLSGHHHFKNEDEESFISKIVKTLKRMQNPQELHVIDHLAVGIKYRVEKLISSLRLDLKDAFIVAVLGISGIGKTTIAKATFNRIAAKFDAHCFLEDIHYYCGSRNWKVDLQKELISCLSQNDKIPMIHSNNGVSKIRKLIRGQKVLLVLDDVDNFEQLKTLGIHPAFFENGSRIIVTTRDKRSLGSLPYVSYNTSFLNIRESIKLFTQLTYEKGDPIDKNFVFEIARSAAGLPLVLEIWSRHFRHYEREQWPSVLKTLKAIPHGDVQKKLQMSYDSLTNRAKKLFLDIACFFVEMGKDGIVRLLQDEDSGFFPDNEIQCLADRGLVIVRHKLGFNRVLMNHAIREMGEEIVRQENEDEPGKRTRLTKHNVVAHVLTEFSGTQSVEIICHSLMKSECSTTVQVEALRKMSNLRLIRLDNVDISETCCIDDMAPLSFQKLKFLHWSKFPFKRIKIDMTNVVVVVLENSNLEILWEGIKSLNKLRILDVSYSKSLTKTGDFIGLKDLEELYFKGCSKLEELDSSVCCLEKLVTLDLNGCKRLERFPWEMIGKLPSLQVLDLTSCASIGLEHDEVIKPFLSCLKETRITRLVLADCNIYKVPCEVGSLTCLKHLDLRRNRFHSLPDSLGKLDQLETIDLSYCYSLQSIPYLPKSTCSVSAHNCESLTTLPPNILELTSLKELDLSNCSKLGMKDPEFLMKLTGLTSLYDLDVGNCNVSQVPSEIENLVSLCNVNLSRNTFSCLPNSFSNLLKLSNLNVMFCSKLTSLPSLPSSLIMMKADWHKIVIDNDKSVHSIEATGTMKIRD